MPLTDIQLRALSFENGQRDYRDRDGLFVRVGRKTKTFMVTIHTGTKRKRVAIGRYPELSLSNARKLAQQHRSAAIQEPEIRLTFEQALESYYRIHGPKQRPVTREECQRLLNKHFRPTLASVPIDKVTTAQLATILDSITHASVRRCAQVFLRAFFNWSYKRGYIEQNPTTRLEAPPEITSRDHVPTLEEIARIWHACPDSDYGQIIKLCIVSGQRIGQWMHYQPEYRQSDVIIWPAAAMKSNRPHALPVTPLLASLLPSQPFSWRMNVRSKRRLDTASGVSGWRHHDMRRLVATVMVDELGVSDRVVEAILAHASGSQVSRTYMRAKLLQPMREALELWERKLAEILR